MRIVAGLVGLLRVLGSGAVDWNSSWTQCAHDYVAPDPGGQGRRLLEDEKVVKDNYQIMFVNSQTGKLEMNEQAHTWAQMQLVDEPVKIIVLFGKGRSGKSTIASFLGCEMNRDDAFIFPTYAETVDRDAQPFTEGIWASRPFDYTDKDGTTSKYMIFDMQSMGRLSNYSGLSFSRMNDNLYKMLALLSEVTSTFVQVLDESAADVDDWNLIGGAFKTTRESIVSQAEFTEGDGAPVNEEQNIRARGEPAMVLLPRRIGAQSSLVESDDFASNTANFESWATTDYNVLQNDLDENGVATYALLMDQNFEPIAHGDTQYPFAYGAVPSVIEPVIADGGLFNWDNQPAYRWEDDGACSVYDRMWSSYWNCTILSDNFGAGPARPSSPSLYRLGIQHLAEKVATEGPVRMLKWKDQLELVPLTGKRLKEVLEQGITEMNSVGPLPQSELWRRIMEDRCDSEVVEFLDISYGWGTGLVNGTNVTGTLLQIDEGLANLDNGSFESSAEMEVEWGRLRGLWVDRDAEQDMANWFDRHPLMQSVQETCSEHGSRFIELLDATFERQQEEFRTIHERTLKEEVQDRLRRVQSQLEALQWETWWQQWRFYILVFGVLGLIVLTLVMRIWRQINTTFRFCCACCGDCGDTKIETTVVQQVKDDGTTVTGIHHATEGPSLPLAFATAVGSSDHPSVSEERYRRLQELDNTINELKATEARKAV